MKKPRKRCHNCNFAGDKFRALFTTCYHCENRVATAMRMLRDPTDNRGFIHPIDFVVEFWDYCDQWEDKTK